MTQLEINQQTAEKLKELSRQAKKSVDEVLLWLLNNYSNTIIEADRDDADAETWTEAELAELLKPKPPLTGKEIAESGLLGSWKDMGIEDSVVWLEEQRAERRKKYQW